jgi:hypothetical protein
MLFRLSPPRRKGLWALACVFGLCSPAYAAGLNDTGITFCADDSSTRANCATVGADSGTHPRQDATQGRDAAAKAGNLIKVGAGNAGFDFTKIANNGSDLPASAALGSGPTDWACTRDNVTGLTWEVKTTSGLRSKNHTYTWYNGDASSNGGNAGYASGGTCYQSGRCDTEKFVQDVNAAGLCGTTSGAWRMPTVKELEGIADLGQTGSAIDTNYFPNFGGGNFPNWEGGNYWSGSPYSIDVAWVVGISLGNAGAVDKRSYNLPSVRLVRGGQ